MGTTNEGGTLNVTRQQLQNAIEDGIRAAEDSFDPERVREVGRTTERFAVGDYLVGEVGCPIAQAFPNGLLRDLRFAIAFDVEIRKIVGGAGRARVIEVIG